MQFVKMTGIGNDYIYVDGFAQAIDNPAQLAKRMSDRHFGVGGDGLILILPADDGVDAHARMRMFNVDGSEGEMCGNGIRCVCKILHDHRLGTDPDANPQKVQTPAGILTLAYELDALGKVKAVTVDMGPPILEPTNVPIDPEELTPTDQPQTFKISVPGTTERFEATFVSMGNPHAVIYVEEVSDTNRDKLLAWGKALENHPAFPNRMNIHFVQVLSKEEARVIHWERGSGPTLACGTGACAVCVAGVLNGKTRRALTANLPGGSLQLNWPQTDDTNGGSVFMAGSATEVFTGHWPS